MLQCSTGRTARDYFLLLGCLLNYLHVEMDTKLPIFFGAPSKLQAIKAFPVAHVGIPT